MQSTATLWIGAGRQRIKSSNETSACCIVHNNNNNNPPMWAQNNAPLAQPHLLCGDVRYTAPLSFIWNIKRTGYISPEPILCEGALNASTVIKFLPRFSGSTRSVVHFKWFKSYEPFIKFNPNLRHGNEIQSLAYSIHGYAALRYNTWGLCWRQPQRSIKLNMHMIFSKWSDDISKKPLLWLFCCALPNHLKLPQRSIRLIMHMILSKWSDDISKKLLLW